MGLSQPRTPIPIGIQLNSINKCLFLQGLYNTALYYDSADVIWSCIWNVPKTTQAIIADTSNIPTLFNTFDIDSIFRTDESR